MAKIVASETTQAERPGSAGDVRRSGPMGNIVPGRPAVDDSVHESPRHLPIGFQPIGPSAVRMGLRTDRI